MAPSTPDEDPNGLSSPKSVSRFPKVSRQTSFIDKDAKLEKLKAKLKNFNAEDVDESPPIPTKEISMINKGHVEETKRRISKQFRSKRKLLRAEDTTGLSDIEETTGSPPPTPSPPRILQGAPLSELAIRLRVLQAQNRKQESIIAQQAIKIRILTDVKGVSVEDVKGALSRASEAEAHAQMASCIAALEAQIELSHQMSSKNKPFNSQGRAATEARIVGLELQVGELEELNQEERKKRWDLKNKLRGLTADGRRLELMCAMKNDAIEKATRVPNKLAMEWAEAVEMENLARRAEGRQLFSDKKATLQGILQLWRMKEARQDGVLYEECPEWGLDRRASEGGDSLMELESEAAVEARGGGDNDVLGKAEEKESSDIILPSTRGPVVPAEMTETQQRKLSTPVEDAKWQAQQDDHLQGETAPAEDAESAARIAGLLHQHRASTARGSRDWDPAGADRAGWAELQAELEVELEATAQEEATSAEESLREQQLEARLELQETFVSDLQQQIYTLEFLGRAYEHQAKHHETRQTVTEQHLIKADKIAGDLLNQRGERVQIEGYLWKCSSRFMAKWERQFFRLIRDHDGVLKLLYGEEPASPSKKFADSIVQRSTNVNTSSKHRGRKHVLRLTVRRKDLYLAADSDPDLERWATTFRRALNPNPPTTPDEMESPGSGYMSGYMRSKEEEGVEEDEQMALAKCLSLSESFLPTQQVTPQRI